MVKASEYKKSFKDRPETAQIHQDGFDYRLERRRAEHSHSIDAFLWDTGSETDSDLAENVPRPGSVPAHKHKHEKFNQAYKEKVRESQELQLKKEAPVVQLVKSKKAAVDEDLHLEIPSPIEFEIQEKASKAKGKCPIHQGNCDENKLINTCRPMI